MKKALTDSVSAFHFIRYFISYMAFTPRMVM